MQTEILPRWHVEVEDEYGEASGVTVAARDAEHARQVARRYGYTPERGVVELALLSAGHPAYAATAAARALMQEPALLAAE